MTPAPQPPRPQDEGREMPSPHDRVINPRRIGVPLEVLRARKWCRDHPGMSVTAWLQEAFVAGYDAGMADALLPPPQRETPDA